MKRSATSLRVIPLVTAASAGLAGLAQAVPLQATATQNNAPFAVSSTDLLQTTGAAFFTTGNMSREGVLGVFAAQNGIYGPQGGSTNNGGQAFTAGAAETMTIQFPNNGVNITALDTFAAWDSARGNQRYQFEYQSTAQPGVWHRLAQVLHSPPFLNTNIMNTRVGLTDSTGILASNVSHIRFKFGDTDFWGWNGYREIDVHGTVAAAPVGPQFMKSVQISELYTVSNTDLLQSGGITTTTSGNLMQENVLGAPALVDGGFGPAGGAGANPPGMAAASGDAFGMVTYGLNLGASPQGYSLSGADIYAGWDGFRGGQKFTLSYSLVTAPSTFIPMGTVDWDLDANNTPGGNINTRTMVRDADGELAANVAAVRVEFAAGTVGFLGYREIDIFGTPSPVPEPAAAGLAAAGAALLLRRRRH